MVETVHFTDFLGTIGVLATVIFVLTSMLGMGFSLTLREIIEPLKNTRLVILTLLANFVLVPLVSLLLLMIVPLSEGLSIGFLLLSTAAGAPFLPKLAQVAKGDIAFAVGMMVLLMVVTIAYVPIVLPFLLTGVTINPWDIARSLILLMLIPLAFALLIRARYEEIAESLMPLMTQATNLSLLVLVVAFFVVYFNDLAGTIGSNAIIMSLVFLLLSLFIGYVLGGTSGSTKRVLAVGTAQRNLSAALAISSLNFNDPDVMVMILVVGLVGLILLMFVGGEMGKHAKETENINPEDTGA